MASKATSGEYVTVVLGDEFDDVLRVNLFDVFRQIGAVAAGSSNKSLAGSQELEEVDVYVEGQLLHVEAETYVGLTISGPADVVFRIQGLIATSQGRGHL